MFSVTARSLFAGHRAYWTARSVVSSTGKSRKYSSTVHDNDAELLEREKRRNLSGTQHSTSSPIDNAPGWNEYLATTSEANVKADRSTLRPEELQAQTVNHIHARHRIDDRPEATGTMDVRDEVSGPLRSAQGGGVDSLADVDPGNNVDSNGRTVFRSIVREEQVDIKKGP